MIEVAVAVVNSAALVAVALVANRSRQHAKAAREQVQNTHSTNLRDDIDQKFREIHKRLDTLDRQVHRRRPWWHR